MKQRGIFEKDPGSGIWWIRYADATGRIRREKAGLKSSAITLYQKRKTEALQGKKLPERLRGKVVSFAEIAQDALAYSKAYKRSYRDDVFRMKRLSDWFGNLPAEGITPNEIERRLSKALEDQGWKPATANRYRALLSLVYRLAIRNKKVAENPTRLVRHRKENNARVRWLTAEEERGLRKVIQGKYHEHLPEFDFALNTGLRLSEMYGSCWESFKIEHRLLTVPRSKDGEMRHIPLNRAALAALAEEEHRGDGTGLIFRNAKAIPLAGPRHWFEPAVKGAGVKDFTWHCLRHTFASRLVMRGVDLRTVQELMGHKTIAMTCRYTHLAPTHQLAAVERLCDPEDA